MIATETGSVVEWSREVNYKLRMSSFRSALLTHYTSAAALNAQSADGLVVRGVHPDMQQSRIVQDLESEPLEDLSISRPRERIEWGISVPDDPTQTVYVWFDALLVYLSGIGYPDKQAVWPPDVQVIGKDIVRFVSFCRRQASLVDIGIQFSCSLLTFHPTCSWPPHAKNTSLTCTLDCEPEKDVQIPWERHRSSGSDEGLWCRRCAVLPRARWGSVEGGCR